jgi:carbamoyl-phosphate synthase large subunit
MNCKTNYKSTSALFEPTLDYVIVKNSTLELYNLKELIELGLQMKSVGEVIRLDVRSKKHCINSIIRNKRNGLGADGKGYTIMNKLSRN